MAITGQIVNRRMTIYSFISKNGFGAYEQPVEDYRADRLRLPVSRDAKG
jgi:hypothetical protein